jgi:hypothetical protein
MWDELYRNNRRKQERIRRIIEELMAQGADAETAYSAAIEQVVGSIRDSHDSPYEESAYLEEPEFEGPDSFDEEPSTLDSEERHPLLDRATALLKEFFIVSNRTRERSTALDSLLRGAMETSGGLVQALSDRDDWSADFDARGLSIVQLKRALRGAAFVVGSLYQLGVEKIITEDEFTEFKAETDAIQTEIVGLLKELRSR